MAICKPAREFSPLLDLDLGLPASRTMRKHIQSMVFYNASSSRLRDVPIPSNFRLLTKVKVRLMTMKEAIFFLNDYIYFANL